jgi:hypothetical protein
MTEAHAKGCMKRAETFPEYKKMEMQRELEALAEKWGV